MENNLPLLNTILESQRGLILFSLDNHYRYTFFSDEHARRIKERYNETLHVGKDIFELLKNPVEKSRVKANFDRVLSGESFSVEESFAGNKQQTRLFENHYGPIKNEKNKVIGLSVLSVDITKIKLAEQERIAIESSYQTLLENSNDAIFIMQAEGPDVGKIITANKAAAKMHGYSYDEFMTLNVREIDTQDAAEQFDDRLNKILSGEKLSFEVMHKRKDGSTFPLAVATCALSIGGKLHTLSINRDITEHEEIIEAARERERFIQTIATASPDLIYVFDFEKRKIIYSNRRLGEELGYSNEEIEKLFSEAPLPFIHPDDLKLAAERTKQWESTQENEIVETQLRLLSKAGEWRWFTVRETIFKRDKNGKVIQTVGTARDRTDNRKSMLALQQSEERFMRLQEASFGGVVVHDQGKIIDANQGLADMTGFSVQQLVGMDGLLLIAPEFREHVTQKIRVGYELPYDVIGVKKDGSRYHLEIQGKNIPYENRLVRVTEFRDISERKQIEEAVREQNVRLAGIADTLTRKNEQLEEFTQIVSHNLRAPVGNIVTLLALYESADQEEREEYFQHLRNSSSTLLSSLNELNEVLKVKQSHNIEIQVLQFELVSEKVFQMLSGSISELDADIQAVFSAAPTVSYPNIYLESIILNLLSNALKYHDPKRRPLIRIKTYQQGSQTFLEVQDNGLGIDLQKYGHHLFKMRKTFHEHPESRGLGLFLIKNQIESMGGEITVKSEVNFGTTFYVKLTP